MAPLWSLLFIVEAGLAEAFSETLRPRDGADPDVIPGWVSALVVAVRSCEELLKLWPPSARETAIIMSAVMEHVGGLATEFLGMYRLNKRPRTTVIPEHIMLEYDQFMTDFTSELEGMTGDIIDWVCGQQEAIVTKHTHVLAACQLAFRKCNRIRTQCQTHRFTTQLEHFCDSVRRGVQERLQSAPHTGTGSTQPI